MISRKRVFGKIISLDSEPALTRMYVYCSATELFVLLFYDNVVNETRVRSNFFFGSLCPPSHVQVQCEAQY